MYARPSADRQSRTRGLALLAVALLAFGLAACVPPDPPPPPPPPPPTDIETMTDAQLETALAELAPDVLAGADDPDFRSEIPEEYRDSVADLLAGLESPDGRAEVGRDLRAAAVGALRGLPTRGEQALGGVISDGSGGSPTTFSSPTPQGVRDGDPAPAIGTSVPFAATSGPCNAPNGVGDVPIAAAPSAGGHLLSPQHDVFTVAQSSTTFLQPGRLSPNGQEPIVGQGPGIQFRGGSRVSGAGQQMLVRVHLEDPRSKGPQDARAFGPRALRPIIRIRPIGGGPTDEYQILNVPDRAQPNRPYLRDARTLCYGGDTSINRGYFEAWVPIPRGQPGFQVIVEVAENDYYFATQPVFPKDLLAISGPQFWAGADRSTVHVGASSVTSAQPIPRSIGAFASATTDPGDGTQNVLTDTNGEPSDDLEQPIRRLINETVSSSVTGALANDLFEVACCGLDLLSVQATLDEQIASTTDVRMVDPSAEPELAGQPISGEIAGAFRAVRADIDVGADVGVNTSMLGVSCYNFLSARVDASVDAWAWADSPGNENGFDLRLLTQTDSEVDMDLERLGWLNPFCVLSRTIGPAFYGEVDSALQDAVATSLVVDPDQCDVNRTVLSSPYDSNAALICPKAFADPKEGTLGRLLFGFDLNAYLPGVANLKPLVTNIDNAWCRASNGPAGCTPDQSLIGKGGVEVTADATIFGSLSDAFGSNLQGRFRNVYAPPLYASIEDVVVTHSDGDGQRAGIGLVVDPRQINLALRHLAQGSGTSRTTDGLLDLEDIAIGSGSLSIRPEVAPMVLGLPQPDPIPSPDPGGTPGAPTIPGRALMPVVLADMRLDVVTAPGTQPIELAAAVRADVGVGFNPNTGSLTVVIEDPVIDIQAINGCQADYKNAYASSYFVCGRAGGGNNLSNYGLSNTSLLDIVNNLVNEVARPALDGAVGELQLPGLNGILPGLNVALTNIRSAQRGGHLGIYADLKPSPRASIAPSDERLPSGSRILRFFPSNLLNLDVANVETAYTWEIRDGISGQPVATTTYYGLLPEDAAVNYAVQAPIESFTLGTDNIGQFRSAYAKLTITQPSTGTRVETEGTYRWALPTPPPPTGCPEGPATFLIAPGQNQPPQPCPVN